jgi:hypothetical protein
MNSKRWFLSKLYLLYKFYKIKQKLSPLLTSRNPFYEKDDVFIAFLERLAGDAQEIDNLRLPLQVALLISPIFLLQDIQIHLSQFYSQRYKMILASI